MRDESRLDARCRCRLSITKPAVSYARIAATFVP
jgi:hypothetical protein